MRKWSTKTLAWLLTFVMVLSVFFGNTTISWATDTESGSESSLESYTAAVDNNVTGVDEDDGESSSSDNESSSSGDESSSSSEDESEGSDTPTLKNQTLTLNDVSGDGTTKTTDDDGVTVTTFYGVTSTFSVSGAADATGNYSCVIESGGDYVSVTPTDSEDGSFSVKALKAGTATLKISREADESYSAPEDLEFTIEVKKDTATVGISVSDQYYNGSELSYSYTVTTKYNGTLDNSVVTVSVLPSGSDPGDYTYSVAWTDSDSADCYELNYTTASASIKKIPLTIKFTANNKVYDGTKEAKDCITLTISADDGVSLYNEVTPTLSDLDYSAVFEKADIGTDIVVTLTIYGWSSSSSNKSALEKYYELPTTDKYTDTADITKIPLTIESFVVEDKKYDATTNADIESVVVKANEGTMVEGEVSLSDLECKASFVDANVGSDKTVTLEVEGFKTTGGGSTDSGDFDDYYYFVDSDGNRSDDATTETPQYVGEGNITVRTVYIQSIDLSGSGRIYDGTTVISFKSGTVKLSEDDSGNDDLYEKVDGLTIQGTANLESANVEEYGKVESVISVDAYEDGRKNGNFTVAASLDGVSYGDTKAVITQATIFVVIGTGQFYYTDMPGSADNVETRIVSSSPETQTNCVEIYAYVTKGKDGSFGLESGDEKFESLETEAENVIDGASAILKKTGDKDYLVSGTGVDTYEGCLTLKEVSSTDSNAGNYKWEVADGGTGTVVVLPDPNEYSVSDLTTEGNTFLDSTTLYVKSGTYFTIKYSPSGSAASYFSAGLYDGVWISNSSDSDCTADFEISANDSKTVDDIISTYGDTIYLRFGVGGKNLSGDYIEVTLVSDGTDPTATFSVDEKASSLQSFGKAVTFGLLDRTTVTVGVTLKDTGAGFTTSSGSALDGLATVKVALCSGDQDTMEVLVEAAKDGSISQTELESLGLNWTTPSMTVTRSTVTAAKAYKVSADSYAVAFVYVEDVVGNCVIYGSNGIIVDVTLPDVPLIRYESTNYGDGVYGGNVTVSITATEELGSSGVTTGLASVTYTIYKDGKAVSGYTDIELFTDSIGSMIEAGKVTISDIQGDSSMKLSTEMTIPSSVFNSNNVYVSVTAKDHAGNSFTNTADTVKIDITTPTISVTYDNNDAQNTRYFKKNRTAIIVYTDRNFDIKNAAFNLTTESSTYTGITFESLSSIEGISTAFVSDSQGSKSGENYTDKRTNTVTITFSGDNTYTIVPLFQDLAGNQADTATYASSTASGTETKFVIDKTAPTVTITYYDADSNKISVGKSESERTYEDGTVKTVITVTEHNFAGDSKFASGQIVYTVSATDADGKSVSISDYQSSANTRDSWSNNVDEWSSPQFKFTTDGNYIASFTYTDLAGNSVTWKSDYYTVDKTAPNGTVTVGSLGFWSRLLSTITFGLFSPNSQKVKISSDDATSPVASVSWLTSTSKLTKTKLAASTGWTNYSSAFKLSANQQFIVYARVVDKAGNITYLSSNGVVLDTVNPGPTITINIADEGNGIFAGNVPFTVTVTDPTKGDTYSGLASVSYEILCNGAVTQSGSFDSELTPASSRVQTLTRNLTVNASKNNSNDVKIRVTAVDNAGNTASAEKDLRIDITAPTITVTWNDVSPINGSCYNKTRVATVTVTERNFDAAGVRFTITNTDGTQPTISGWSHSSNSGVSDSATHTCTVTFLADGDYTFTLEATDLGNNKGLYSQTDSFTVDQTVPVIRVSYDQTNSNSYYNKERTATIKITEHNFSASAVTATITAALNGAGITAPTLSGWSSSGDTHTATVTYRSDGDYTFTIACTDQAGNTAADYGKDSFTVDTQAPGIEISNIEKANTGTVEPVIEVTDVNYDDTQVTITLTGTNDHDDFYTCTTTAISLGQRFTIADLAHTADMDDIYTLTVTAKDAAGNSSEETFEFSVNRFGSVYTFSSCTEKLLETVYTNDPEDLVIMETNTDSLVRRWIVCSKDGATWTLTEGVDYIVEESGGEGSWKVYTYTILKENFTEDGYYVITMYSEDEAGGTSSNQAREKTIEFIVDRTDPSVVITGVEDGGQYRQNSQLITIDADDNICLAALTLYILDDDGDNIVDPIEFTREQWQGNYGQVEYEAASCSGWQTLRAVAEDGAGNTCITEDIRVLITTNLWLQFYMNKPLFYGSILLLLLLLALLACYVNRKRKQTVSNR